ncbi:hypothetical protein V1520DRAFT_351261 [Lipomyces starkeyi]
MAGLLLFILQLSPLRHILCPIPVYFMSYIRLHVLHPFMSYIRLQQKSPYPTKTISKQESPFSRLRIPDLPH